jgi:hypothetical protein
MEVETLLCRELLGVDVSTPEGIAVVREKDRFRTVYPKFVKAAAELLDRIP